MKKYLLLLILATVVNFSMVSIAQAEVEFKGLTLGKPIPSSWNIVGCKNIPGGKLCEKDTTIVGYKTTMSIFTIQQDEIDVVYQINADFKANGLTYNHLKYALEKKYGSSSSEKANSFFKSIKESMWALDGKGTWMVLRKEFNTIELNIGNIALILISEKRGYESGADDL